MKLFLLSLCLLLFAISACGSDSFSAPTDQQPVVDDQQPDASDNDITYAIFTRREDSCADYAAMYVSDVMDVQRGTSFAGDLMITLSGSTCVFETNAIPNHDFNNAVTLPR